jgi:hypothetical protein
VICILARARYISLLQNAETTSEYLPASYSTDTVSFTLVVKWLGHEKNHSPPSPAEVKECSYSPTPTICFHDYERKLYFFNFI